MHITVVFGTRPEIIKLSPVIRLISGSKHEIEIVHTGQHYSYNLSELFIDELELSEPDWNLGVGSSTHAKQTGKIMIEVENILQQNIPDLVLVHGDTNSTLGAALAASKLNVNLGHIEAGLRSFNENMPEEINRKIVDQISNLNFAPTKVACDNLLDEGIHKSKISVTGNTIKDAIDWIKFNNIWDGEYVDKIGIRHKNYALATIHRAKTTGDIHLFGQIMAGLTEFANKSNLEFVYPIHPRSKQLLKEYNLNVPNQINLIDPLAYSDFLYLVENAKIIFTDSGGVQEEACILGTPCVTLRNDTERPETLKLGCNTLAGYNPRSIVNQGLEQLKTSSVVESPYGQGDSAERIFESILKNCSS